MYLKKKVENDLNNRYFKLMDEDRKIGHLSCINRQYVNETAAM